MFFQCCKSRRLNTYPQVCLQAQLADYLGQGTVTPQTLKIMSIMRIDIPKKFHSFANVNIPLYVLDGSELEYYCVF